MTTVVDWTTSGSSRSRTACASGVTSTRTRRRSSGSVTRSTYPLRSRVSRTLVMVPLVMCITGADGADGDGPPFPSMTASAFNAACDSP